MAKGTTYDGVRDLVRMMGWSQKDGRNAVLLFYKQIFYLLFFSNIFADKKFLFKIRNPFAIYF